MTGCCWAWTAATQRDTAPIQNRKSALAMERHIHNRPPEASMLLPCWTRFWLQSSFSHHWASTRFLSAPLQAVSWQKEPWSGKGVFPERPILRACMDTGSVWIKCFPKLSDGTPGQVRWSEKKKKHTERWSVTSWMPYTVVKNMSPEATWWPTKHIQEFFFFLVSLWFSLYFTTVRSKNNSETIVFFPGIFNFGKFSGGEYQLQSKKCWLITLFLT